MSTLFLADTAGFSVELVGSGSPNRFVSLVCRGGATNIAFNLPAPIELPLAALAETAQGSGNYKLRTLAALRDQPDLQAEYRVALHQAARVTLQAQSFFGVDVATSSAELLLELELAAIFDGAGELAGSVSGRVLAKGKVAIQTGLLEAGTDSGTNCVFFASWALALRFGAEWMASLAWPSLGIELPEWPWPANLSLPGSLPALNLQWQTPAWLREFATQVQVQSANLQVTISSTGLALSADQVSLSYQSRPLVIIEDVRFDSASGGAARRIAFPDCNVGAVRLDRVLGTPLRIETSDVLLRPRLEGLEPKIDIKIEDLQLSEPSGSSLQLGVAFVLSQSGISDVAITIKNGNLSATLVMRIRNLATGPSTALASLVEWTGQVLDASATAIGKLLRFLRALTLPELGTPSMPAPRLPRAGPIRSAFEVLLKLLEKAASSLSVQLVFERSSQRLLRTVVSLRDASSSPLVLDVGGSALQLAIRSGGQARPALVIEHAGPSGGDWFLLLVDENPDHHIELSTNLWLAPPKGNVALQQHSDSNTDSAAAEPLLRLIATPALKALALAGMQSGRPVWFQRYAADSAIDLDSGLLRLALAEGGYGLSPISIHDLQLQLHHQLNGSTLPLLRRRAPEPGAGLAQAILVEQAKLTNDQLTLQIALCLGGQKLGSGELRALFSPHTLSFRLVDAAVDIKISSSPFNFLGLTWSFEGEDPSFRLMLTNEPRLEVAKGKLILGKAINPQRKLKFTVETFALTRAGVSLDATLEKEQSLRLPGVDTDFVFQSAALRIRDGSIQEFTVAAAGNLPAWIGDAKVNAQFRFGALDDRFQLLAAHAELETPGKKVDCRALRFEFSLKLIELDFVRSGADDIFYFRLSGSAEFKPSGGEFDGGLLQHLKNARIELDRTPVTGEWHEVLGSLEFTVPLPKPTEISLFNLYRFQIRSIGFDCKAFGPNDPGIKIAGQCQFAEIGDILAPEIDFHALYIGAPSPTASSPLPRVRFDGLRVALQVASKIRIGGTVLAVDRDLPLAKTLPGIDPSLAAKGFVGDGEVEVPGLPPLAASFGFLEIASTGSGSLVRNLSWFVYVEARKLSYIVAAPIPLFIREIGLGMGYRYTFAGLAKSDELKTPEQLIAELTELAKRQGDLARYSAWTPQVGTDAKLTLAMRALLSMASAAPPQTHQWNGAKEERLPSPFTMDVVAALRSDLSFLMTVRLWLAVNYADYLKGGAELREHPLVVGFLYLSGPRQEFLARLASADQPYIGEHPVVPPLVQRALKSLKYSATLYMRPGLLHFELGWPDQLQWSDSFGPLSISCVGGFVFRVEDSQLLLGMNFGARGRLELSASAGGGSFGASISALAEVGFMARMVAVIDARQLNNSMYYGLVAIDLTLTFRVSAWLRIRVFGRRIGFSISFSFSLYVNVALELVLTGEPAVAGRARARVGIRAFGRSLAINVDLAVGGDRVDRARARVARYLNLGMAGPAELPDPFAPPDPANAVMRAMPAAPQATYATPNQSASDTPVSPPSPPLSPVVFTAYARRLNRLPEGVSGDHVLVALVPRKGERGFFCSPLPWNQADAQTPVRPWDYKIEGLPKDSYAFVDGRWVQATTPVQYTKVSWRRPLGQGEYESLHSLIDGAYHCLQDASGNWRYEDPEPRVIDVGGSFDPQLTLAQAMLDAQRPAADGDDDGANDARDLILAKLHDSLVEYAETLVPNALCLDMGLVFLIPRSAINKKALDGIALERADLQGVTNKVSAPASFKFDCYLAQQARLAGFEHQLRKDRIEFAWDLVWDEDTQWTEQGEAEDWLYGYEVISSIVGSDTPPRLRLVKPGDVIAFSQTGLSYKRSQRQFADDFADIGGIAALAGETVRYAITPIATDGSRGAVYTTRIPLQPIEVAPVPTVAEVSFVLAADVASKRFPTCLEPSGSSLDIRLEFDNSATWPAKVGTSDLRRIMRPDGAELVFRAERIELGGRYAVDQDLGGRESLAQFDGPGPQDLVLPLVWRPPTDKDPGKWLAQGWTSVETAIRASTGRCAWRVYARFTLSGHRGAGAYIPTSLFLVHATERLSVAAFEWPYWRSPGERAASAFAGRLVPVGQQPQPPSRIEQVGYEVSWPAFAQDPQLEPPIEGFILRALALDALPPRLLNANGGPTLDAWQQAQALAAADVRLCRAEYAALSPAHNQDHENWQGEYADGVAGTLGWPELATAYPLPRVEPGLLQHLRGERGWRRCLRVRAFASDQGKEVQIPVHWPPNTPGLTALDHTEGVYQVDAEQDAQQLVRSLRALRFGTIQASAEQGVLRRLLIGVADEESAYFDDYEVPQALTHPDLLHFVEGLALAAADANRNDVRVEYQGLPTDDASLASFQALLDATPESKDPYGHGILHRLGLATSVRFWHRGRRRYLLADELRDLVLPRLQTTPGLHVDFLLQTERHHVVAPFDNRNPQGKLDLKQDGLALLQVSMRPDTNRSGTIQDWVKRKHGDWNVPQDAPLEPWLARFYQHRSPPTRYAYLGRRGEPGAYLAPDQDGRMRVRWRTQDRHAQTHAFMVEVRYRYDAMRKALAYSELLPTLESKPLVAAIERSRAMDPPRFVAARYAYIPCEASMVPVWEVVMSRHPEQALADSNTLAATRLQYLGIATEMRRGPRDPGWLEQLKREQPGLEFPMSKLELRPAPVHPAFEQAWKATSFDDRSIADSNDKTGRPGPPMVELWPGLDVLRYPALPYFYRHQLLAQAESRWVRSTKSEIQDALPDVPWSAREENVVVQLASNGLARIDFVPTRYEEITDPVTLKLAGESGTARSLRHAPDPDVHYQLSLSDDGAEEPLAHILRETGNSKVPIARAYRAVALSGRVRATPALYEDQAQPVPQRLRLHIDVCRVDELVQGSLSNSSGLGDFAEFASGLLKIFAPLNDQRLKLLADAMVTNPPGLLEQARLLDPLLPIWSWRGAIAQEPANWPPELVREYELRLAYTDTSAMDATKKAAVDAWLNERLASSVWQSAAVRRLREALHDPVPAPAQGPAATTLTLLAADFTANPPPANSGWKLVWAKPSAHWLAFGPLGATLQNAILAVTSPASLEQLKAQALARLLGQSNNTLRLRRWRGVSLREGAMP